MLLRQVGHLVRHHQPQAAAAALNLLPPQSSSGWLRMCGFSVFRPKAPPSQPATPPVSDAEDTPPAPSSSPPTGRHVLYKGKWIFPFRLLVRGKVFQLLGVAGVTGATVMIVLGKDVSTLEAAGLGALGLGTAAASMCLWYYSRRYVGELSLLEPERKVARFSTLDFWGNREDTDVAVERIKPPFKGLSQLALRKLVASPLFPINVEGDRQYFMSARYAVIADKETLTRLMDGRYLEDLKKRPPS